MSDEIGIIRDAEGMALFGDPTTIRDWLVRIGIDAEPVQFGTEGARAVLVTAASALAGASLISSQSGRYLRLTKESAQSVARHGLPSAPENGTCHAMILNGGKIQEWLSVETGISTLLNPAVLAGAGTILAQLARQQEARELKDLLTRIDSKLDDVRRAQRDTELARLDRVGQMLGEAMLVRTHEGDQQTSWEKVVSESGVLAEVQGRALRALSALADTIQQADKAAGIRRATSSAEEEAGIWLAVLARSVELQNDFAVLELDHVLATAPEAVDGHRRGLEAAVRTRRQALAAATDELLEQLERGGQTARAAVLLHARSAPQTVAAVNTTGAAIEEFRASVDIETEWSELQAQNWSVALRDPEQRRKAVEEAGPAVSLVAFGVLSYLPTTAALTRRRRDERSTGEDAARTPRR